MLRHLLHSAAPLGRLTCNTRSSRYLRVAHFSGCPRANAACPTPAALDLTTAFLWCGASLVSRRPPPHPAKPSVRCDLGCDTSDPPLKPFRSLPVGLLAPTPKPLQFDWHAQHNSCRQARMIGLVVRPRSMTSMAIFLSISTRSAKRRSRRDHPGDAEVKRRLGATTEQRSERAGNLATTLRAPRRHESSLQVSSCLRLRSLQDLPHLCPAFLSARRPTSKLLHFDRRLRGPESLEFPESNRQDIEPTLYRQLLKHAACAHRVRRLSRAETSALERLELRLLPCVRTHRAIWKVCDEPGLHVSSSSQRGSLELFTRSVRNGLLKAARSGRPRPLWRWPSFTDTVTMGHIVAMILLRPSRSRSGTLGHAASLHTQGRKAQQPSTQTRMAQL